MYDILLCVKCNFITLNNDVIMEKSFGLILSSQKKQRL